MENLPVEILRIVSSYVGGEEIHFQRDEEGRVVTIIGLKDDHLFSKAMFIYDDESIGVHCTKNINEEWNPDSDPIIMVDFHIISFNEEKWYCSVDYTELNIHNRTVDKFVKTYRFYYNEHSKAVKITADGNIVYTAEYDCDGKKLWSAGPSSSTENEYEGNLRIRSKEFQGEDLFQQFEYEYRSGFIGPVAMYEISDEKRSMCQENIFLSEGVEVPKLNACDGVQRNYYTKDGVHLASYYLPPQNNGARSFLYLKEMLDAPEEMPNLYVSITDSEAGTKRIIQRENGRLDMDMVIEFSDGKLSSISHNSAAAFNGFAMSLIEKQWWQEELLKVVR